MENGWHAGTYNYFFRARTGGLIKMDLKPALGVAKAVLKSPRLRYLLKCRPFMTMLQTINHYCLKR